MNRQSRRITACVVVLLALLPTGLQSALGSTVGPVYLSDLVTVYSPVKATYNTPNILFNYTVYVGLGMHISLNYTLDGTLTGDMPYIVINPHELHVMYTARGQVQLPELSEGSHALTIAYQTDFNFTAVRTFVDTIHFAVDLAAPEAVLDATPPTIAIQTPQTNQTYTGTVPLNVLLSEPTTPFTIKIDLNRTLTLPAQNTSLTDLSFGKHVLSIQANDLVGNRGYSKYVTFYVAQPTPTPMPTATPIEPTKPPQQPQDNTVPLVLAVGGVIAVLTLIYFVKKRKR